MHDSDIIHLDVKPENFLFVAGVLKIIDFGVAMVLPEGEQEVVGNWASIAGTFQYQAPEHFRKWSNGKLVQVIRATRTVPTRLSR